MSCFPLICLLPFSIVKKTVTVAMENGLAREFHPALKVFVLQYLKRDVSLMLKVSSWFRGVCCSYDRNVVLHALFRRFSNSCNFYFF